MTAGSLPKASREPIRGLTSHTRSPRLSAELARYSTLHPPRLSPTALSETIRAKTRDDVVQRRLRELLGEDVSQLLRRLHLVKGDLPRLHSLVRTVHAKLNVTSPLPPPNNIL